MTSGRQMLSAASMMSAEGGAQQAVIKLQSVQFVHVILSMRMLAD